MFKYQFLFYLKSMGIFKILTVDSDCIQCKFICSVLLLIKNLRYPYQKSFIFFIVDYIVDRNIVFLNRKRHSCGVFQMVLRTLSIQVNSHLVTLYFLADTPRDNHFKTKQLKLTQTKQ